MSAARSQLSNTQLFDNSGNPLNGGRIKSFVGGTLTANPTYSDAGLSTSNGSIVTADASGRVGNIFLKDEIYRFQIWDSTDSTLYGDFDNVYKDEVFVRSNGLPAVSFPGMKVYNTADGKKYRRNSTGTAWIDEGPVDSIGSVAGVSDIRAGTSATLLASPDAIAGIWQQGADIAAGGTLTIPTTGGKHFKLSGSATTINGINAAVGGMEVWLQANAAHTLTHHGTSFILFGSANITLEVGDIVGFKVDAASDVSSSNWKMIGFQRLSGIPLKLGSTHAATKTEQETGTATDKFVSPGRQHYHKSAVQAWVYFTVTAGTVAVVSSYNVSSVDDDGAGAFGVNFTQAFSSANFAAIGMCDNSAVGSTSGFDESARTSSTFDFVTRRGSTDAQQDPPSVSLLFLGALAA